MATAEEIAKDAQELRTWLQDAGLSLSAVALAPDAPAHARALWDNVGWHESFRDLELVHPSAESGLMQVQSTLEEWRRDDGSALPFAALPTKFRLVQPNSSGEGFTITDEDDGSDDPPLVGVVRDQRKRVVATRRRYVKHASTILVKRALAGMYQTDMMVSLKDDSPLRGTPVLKALGTDLKRLDEGLFLLSRRKDGELLSLLFAHANFDVLVRWLWKLGAKKNYRALTLPLTGVAALHDSSKVQSLVSEMTDVRGAPHVDDRSLKVVVGQLDGHWLLAEHGGVKGFVHVDASNRGAFAAVAARACPVDMTPSDVPPGPSIAQGDAPSEPQVRAAATALVTILDELCPQHTGSRRPVNLEDDTPRYISMIAEAVGGSLALPPQCKEAKVRSCCANNSRPGSLGRSSAISGNTFTVMMFS